MEGGQTNEFRPLILVAEGRRQQLQIDQSNHRKEM